MFNVKMQSSRSQPIGVIVTAGGTPNSLGVIRSFGRRGIRVVYIDSEPASMVRYSRYINQRLKCQSAWESEIGFIGALLAFGKQNNGKLMIVPTGDTDVVALSKHKHELEQFYYLPVPAYETAQKLINKKSFYKMLAGMQIPHPRTYFPENLRELWVMGLRIDYPYIIKPAYSQPFQAEFGRKNFLINSAKELDRAIGRLRGKDLEVMIQEIVPGREIYNFYTYLNRESEPLAVCGYDKIRQYPPDFGSGSFCESAWRPSAVRQVIDLLREIGYHGFAEPELKKDPRDGKYKLLEINARTTLQNRLAAACGVDMEYIAFLDANGLFVRDSVSFRNEVLWVDDFVDLVSFLLHLKRREIGIDEIVRLLKPGKVHSVAAWDDPLPLIVHAANLGFRGLRLLLRSSSRVPGKSNG